MKAEIKSIILKVFYKALWPWELTDTLQAATSVILTHCLESSQLSQPQAQHCSPVSLCFVFCVRVSFLSCHSAVFAVGSLLITRTCLQSARRLCQSAHLQLISTQRLNPGSAPTRRQNCLSFYGSYTSRPNRSIFLVIGVFTFSIMNQSLCVPRHNMAASLPACRQPPSLQVIHA